MFTQKTRNNNILFKVWSHVSAIITFTHIVSCLKCKILDSWEPQPFSIICKKLWSHDGWLHVACREGCMGGDCLFASSGLSGWGLGEFYKERGEYKIQKKCIFNSRMTKTRLGIHWGDSAIIILIPDTNFADNKFQMIIKWSFIQISPTFMAY